MATITGTPTLPQVEGILRRDFFRAFLQETGLGATGTATGGTVGTIIDTTRLMSSQYDSKDHVGGWARIAYDAGGAGAAPEGEQAAVTTYTPSSGTIANNPNFTVAPAVGDLYELWHNVNPADAKDMLDSCLINDLWFPCWTLLTEVPDGDMEQNNTTDWTGVNATVTKETAEPAMSGKRYLKVLATAANGYAKNAADLLVETNTKYHASVLTRGAGVVTARMQVWDATNSVEITHVDFTRQYPARIWCEFTTPATCELLQIRMTTVENGQYTTWDDLVVYPVGATNIRLPWWMKNRNQLLGVCKLAPTAISDGVWDSALNGEPDKRFYVMDQGVNQLRIVSRMGEIGGNPLFVLGLRNETQYLNDNTEKKYVDPNLMFAAFGYKVYSLLYQRNINNSVQASKMKEMRDTFYWNWKQAESAQLEELNRIFANTTQPEVMIRDEFSRFQYGR